MARALDIFVVIAPPLRPVFEGRREVALGVPATSGVGDVLEVLLSLYPGLRPWFAGDAPATGGHYVQVALDERAFAQLASGGTGLSMGGRLLLFVLSRPPPGSRAGASG